MFTELNKNAAYSEGINITQLVWKVNKVNICIGNAVFVNRILLKCSVFSMHILLVYSFPKVANRNFFSFI